MTLNRLAALTLLLSTGTWAAAPGAPDAEFGNSGKVNIAIADVASGSLQLTGLHQLIGLSDGCQWIANFMCNAGRKLTQCSQLELLYTLINFLCILQDE